MNKPSVAFVAQTPPTSVFAGAEQADDYDEEVATKSRGARPRRSDSLPSPIEDAVVSTDIERTPRSFEVESGPVNSTLFAGATQLLESTTAARLPVARQGGRGFLNRLGFHLAPGADEAEQIARTDALDAARTRIRQATWTRAASVLVANPKGGTGKTPIALLLGGALASIRGGSVAVLEVADDPGALAYRAEGNPRLGVGDLVRDAARIRTAGQLAGYTAPQTSFAAVIGSTGLRSRLDADAVAAIVHVIDEYYAVRVMDSGNQPTSTAFQGALDAADVLVVPIVNAGDSTLEAMRMLDGMKAAGGHAKELAEQAIIARVTDGRPEHRAVAAEISRIIAAAGVGTVCDLPYDPHIAERGQITLARLQPDTITAFTHLADAVVASMNEHVTSDYEEAAR